MPSSRLTGNSRRLSFALSAVLVAFICAIAVYWAMQLLAPRVAIAPSGSLVSQSGIVDPGVAGRLFGVAGQRSVRASRVPDNIRVLGVIASSTRAAAILQVNNQAAAPYGIGQTVDGQLTVKSVSRDEVVLDRDGEELRAPAPARSDTSVLGGQATPNAPQSTINAAAPNRVAAASSARPPLPPRPLPPSGAQAAVVTPKVQAGMAPDGGRAAQARNPRVGAGVALRRDQANARRQGS